MSKPKQFKIKEPLLIDDNYKEIFYSTNLDEIGDFPYMQIYDAFLIPLLGVREWDGHIFITGATGAGKSYLIRKIVDNDKKKRQVILFTNLKDDDPAFTGMNYVKYSDDDPVYNAAWLNKNDKNKIMIFDDTLNNKDYNAYRDKQLEEARKKGTTIICVNHKIQDHNNTKVALTDARFVICFPNTNAGQCFRFLKREMELDSKQINDMIKVIKEEGRHMIIHRFSPNFVAGSKSIFKV